MLEANKRMLFVCLYSSPYGGNFVPSLMALEKELSSYRIKCVYCFPIEAQGKPWIAQMIREGKDIVFADFKTSKIKFYQLLKSLVYERQINYVYAHFCPYLPLELIALLHSEVRVFIHIHSDFSAGKELKSVKQKVKCLLLYKVLSKRVHFLCVTPKFVEYNPKRISFVLNGLAKDRISCEHIDGKALRNKCSIADNEVLCEIFGWTPYIKGVDIAVNAIKKINEQYHMPVKLAIICGVAENPKKMKQWVQSNTECTGEESYLLYWEPTEDVFSYHEASDVLLSASRSEGFSYSVLEKLSIGGRCVISDIPGVAWAKEYETVYSFPSGSSSALADAICKAVHAGLQTNADVVRAIHDTYSIDNWTKTIVEKMGQMV